jgi:hypothetical protein
MWKQFETCSYEELTSCIKARIKWIRESREFLKDPNTFKYGHIRATMRLKVLGYKNWDSDKLAI